MSFWPPVFLLLINPPGPAQRVKIITILVGIRWVIQILCLKEWFTGVSQTPGWKNPPVSQIFWNLKLSNRFIKNCFLVSFIIWKAFVQDSFQIVKKRAINLINIIFHIKSCNCLLLLNISSKLHFWSIWTKRVIKMAHF